MAKPPYEDPTLREKVEEFLKSVPNLSNLTNTPQLLVAHFGYFLTVALGEAMITPARIRSCYAAAAIPAPADIYYAMKKSNAFVRTAQGTKLTRHAKTQIQAELTSPFDTATAGDPLAEPQKSGEKARDVVVIYGRDIKIRDSMFQFLTTLRLNPIEWNEAVRRTGLGSPYTGQIVDALFRDAQAIVVVLSPDEYVELRQDLLGADSNSERGWQPRPNVFIEAGMALAKDEAHTILVQIGPIRLASDLHGRNLVKLDDSSAQRHTLAQRLITAGCSAVTTGTDWLKAGTFSVPSRTLKLLWRK